MAPRQSSNLRVARLKGPLERLVLVAVVAGLYYGAAKLGLSLAYANSSVTAVWAPTGIALAALVLVGFRALPGVALGAFLANVSTGNLPLLVVCGITLGNTLEALVGAYLLRRVRFDPSLRRIRDVSALVLLAAALSTTLSATAGVASLRAGGALPSSATPSAWLLWWLGDMGGDLLIAPVIFLVVAGLGRRPSRRQVLETLGILAIVAIVALLVFSDSRPIAYVLFLALVVAGLRFGPFVSSLANLTSAGIAIALTAHGSGPFVQKSLDNSLLLSQTFVAAAAVTGLMLAAVTTERRRAVEALELSRDELEVRVRQRTAELHRSNEDLAGVLRAATEYSIIGTDLEGTITVFNVGAERMLGYTAEEVVGQHTPQLVHDADEVAARATELGVEPGFEVFVAAARRGEAETREWTYLRRDGRRVPVTLTVNAVHDEWGALTGFIGIAADVTRQRELEEAVRKQAAEMRTLVDHAPVGIFSTDAAGACTFVNERWTEISGLTLEDALGEGWVRALHADDKAGVFAEWALATEEQRRFELGYRFQRPDGAVSWVEGRGIALRDEHGVMNGYIGTILDVTERHAIEQERERLITHSRAVLDATTQGILLTDRRGEVILSNSAMRRFWTDVSLADEGTIWERVVQLMQLTEKPEAFAADFANLADEPSAEYVSEFDLPAIDRSFLGRTAPVLDPEGALIGRIFALHETTAERASERAKNAFVATVSHELRTPLTSIIGFLEVLDDKEAALDEQGRSFLDAVRRNARKLAGLVADLLLVSQIESDRLTLSLGAVDLARLVQEHVGDLRQLAHNAAVELRVETPATLLVHGDRERLGQLLDNLASNALKFTPPGGNVRVTLNVRAGSAVMEVSDTGVGIPQDERTRVFERFFRASTAGDNAIPGTGLGLSIARSIAEAHGGKLDIVERQGPGTTFRVVLPLPREGAGAARAA